MADKKNKSEKKDSVKIAKNTSKTSSVKTKEILSSGVLIKKEVPKKGDIFETKKVSSKKTPNPKRNSTIKSVEKEVKEVAVALGHTTQKLGVSALKKVKEATKNIDVKELTHDVQETGKKAFSQAKKTVTQVKNSEILSRMSHKSEGIFSTIKKYLSFVKAPKSLRSILQTRKGNLEHMLGSVKSVSQKKSKTHYLLGLEVSDRLFRSLVLIAMLSVFFVFGVYFGVNLAYQQIRYELGKYERQEQIQDMYQRDHSQNNTVIPTVNMDEQTIPNPIEAQYLPEAQTLSPDTTVTQPIFPEAIVSDSAFE